MIKSRVGETFGHLTILEMRPAKGFPTKILCKCSCGAEILTRLDSLISGATKSCGCLRRKNMESYKEKRNMAQICARRFYGESK